MVANAASPRDLERSADQGRREFHFTSTLLSIFALLRFPVCRVGPDKALGRVCRIRGKDMGTSLDRNVGDSSVLESKLA